MELQRLRNARGLKPSQLARLAGHHSVARLLSEVNISGAHQHTTAAAPSSSGAPAAELPRRVARAGLPARTALPARQALFGQALKRVQDYFEVFAFPEGWALRSS